MSQRSIYSFFAKAPSKSPSSSICTSPVKAAIKEEEDKSSPVKRSIVKDEEDSCSPVKTAKRGSSKRLRIDDSEDSQSPTKNKENVSEPESPAKVQSKVTEEAVDVKVENEAKPEPKSSPKAAEKDNSKKPKLNNTTKKVKESPKPNNVKKTPKNKKAEKKDSPKTTTPTNKRSLSPVSKQPEVKSEESSPSVPKKPNSGLNSFFITKKTDAKESTAKSTDYNPAKSNYHPIDDAMWSRGEKVPYLALAKTLEEIEKISARLKIVEVLSNYFRSVILLSPEDLLPSIYLCLNQLAPAYMSVELGVAETGLMKAIAQSTGRSMAQIKNECNNTGDLGIVAEQSRSNQRMMFQPAPLMLRTVFEKLKDIAQMTGHASMSKKVDKIQSMFVACRQSEARYLIRSLAGKLRIGLAEKSVLQAIAQACTTTPPLSLQGEEWPPKIINASKGKTAENFKEIVEEQALILKTTYCECPNYDMIVPVILKHGIAELPNHCKLTPGIPLKPMLAHPTKGVHEVLQRFDNVEFTCEWKYDGERAQIHVPSKEVDDGTVADLESSSIYSRNQENNTSKYPDVLGRLQLTMKDTVKNCVLDCEAVAWNKEKKQILPFQVLSTRKRKDANESEIKVEVCLFMFDLLYLNGEALVQKPFEERRRLLKEHFSEVEGVWHFATSLDCSTMDSIQEFLEESIKGNCEGLMVKTLNGKDATYEIAKRSRNWLKLKKDYLEGVGDTIDAIVLGGYLGRGKRAGVYGGFLLACYDQDNEEYQTLCKIGTGFSDEDLQNFSKSLVEHKIGAPKNYYRYDTSLEPDHWFAPAQVWEIKCADLSLSPIHRAAIGIVDPEKGISLRFPRFVRVREDKTADNATSAQQISELYLSQDQVKNQTQGSSKNVEEDFY